MSKIYHINDIEQKAIDEFLLRTDVQQVLTGGDGGEFSLVFSRQSGIGVSVIASVKDSDGTVTISENVTDYGCW